MKIPKLIKTIAKKGKKTLEQYNQTNDSNMPQYECPVCYEVCLNREILACGHHLCSKCLSNIKQSPTLANSCPTCRTSFNEEKKKKRNQRSRECTQESIDFAIRLAQEGSEQERIRKAKANWWKHFS